MRRIAEAMNCRLQYVVLPQAPFDSLEAILESRAYKAAEKIVAKVSHTMALEDQELAEKEHRQQVSELAGDLLKNLDKRIWDEV